MDQSNQLKSFFSSTKWRSSIDRFSLSGNALVDQVNALEPRIVVDVGCGFNPFKGKIRNLIGIDLANDHADLICDLSDGPFAQGSIDIVLALGSINFGDEDDIRSALATVGNWLRPGGRIFMRANPGEPIGEGIIVFPWSTQYVEKFADLLGFRIISPIQEEDLVLSNGVPAHRLFWIYQKN